MSLFCLTAFLCYIHVSDLNMPVQAGNKQSLRAEKRRLKALLEEATRENDKAEALVAAIKREKEVMRLMIAALEGSSPVSSE